MLYRRPQGKHHPPGDDSFFVTAIRELDEEFVIPTSTLESTKVLSLNVEY